MAIEGGLSRYSALMELGIDLHRHGQGAIERSGQPLAAVEAHLLRIGKLLLPGNADGVVLGLDFQVGLVDARELYDGDQVVALLEDVDGRERPAASRRPTQPFAVEAQFESSLKLEQCVEWMVHD